MLLKKISLMCLYGVYQYLCQNTGSGKIWGHGWKERASLRIYVFGEGWIERERKGRASYHI